MLKDYIWQILLTLAVGFSSWLFGKLQTKREQKQTDLQIIDAAIKPLLESIKSVTVYNNTLVQQYLDEQNRRMAAEEENKQLKAERSDLNVKISKLTAKVDKLEKVIMNLTKHEKDSISGDDAGNGGMRGNAQYPQESKS